MDEYSSPCGLTPTPAASGGGRAAVANLASGPAIEWSRHGGVCALQEPDLMQLGISRRGPARDARTANAAIEGRRP
jgi:hypothetical protein